MSQLIWLIFQLILIITHLPFSLFPRYHLCSSKKRTAVCRYLYGNNRRGDLRDAADEEGCVSASSGNFHPLLWCQRRARWGWLHLIGPSSFPGITARSSCPHWAAALTQLLEYPTGTWDIALGGPGCLEYRKCIRNIEIVYKNLYINRICKDTS